MNKNRSNFTLKKMTDKLDEIMDKYVGSIPSEVQLKLPKLKKRNNTQEQPKIKLPKLKKVTEEV